MADKGRRNTFEITNDSGTSKKSNISRNIEAELEKMAKNGAKVNKQAKILAQKVYSKYVSGTIPTHEILEKMIKYKKENKWSDKEYDEFFKEFKNLLTGNRAMEIDYNQNVIANKSIINRALGSTKEIKEIIREADPGIRLKESEKGILSEILSMYDKTSDLHRSVFMHSLMYEDCSPVAITGEYDRKRHIASNYIDPILACMFIPKIDIFEIHMLYANFGSIIKARYEKRPISNEPDSLLFYDITSDPNDVVCEINSPIADLRNRYRVQISLWETVLKLRNGSYYEADSISEFMRTLNACRNNLYDNADQAYNQDEGAIMRRLLSVFSLRPTIIYTKPVYSVASFAMGQFMPNMIMGPNGIPCPPGQAMNPFNNQPIYTITSIPMITLQIPTLTPNAEPIDIRTAVTQTVWINENKTIVPKEQSVIYSKEVLIFYVNRRIQKINIKTYSNPLTFSQLPLTLSSFERLNSYPINVPERLVSGKSEEVYNLRSVVTVTETQIGRGASSEGIITGRTGLIMTHRNFEQNKFEQAYYLYDPFGASLPVRHPEQDGYFTNKPISTLQPLFTPPAETTGGIVNPSFFDRASRTGTIFIYAKPQGYNPNESITLV
ncbi:putative core protein [Cotonvirus japonicus]|uniref:Core protein n=1 Tax=Cotonvirus japonicus TaxID=2811091 RepID=A0ABM7NSK1_9VIRU|nr:putative core protein [Cotonvirus japonicus]BCS83145.1 putative core protein [Cotonvirus japonicus]